MVKNNIIFLIFIFTFIRINTKENSIITVKLTDLKEKSFSLNNQIIIFEYENKIERIYNSSINFIFKYGEKSSTKVYIYDSLDKIINDYQNEFVNFLKESSLKETKCITISTNDSFYNDNTTYYIVLYDFAQAYSDSIYVINSLKYLTFGNSFSYRTNCSSELTFNFLVEISYSTYLHYQACGTGFLSGSSYYIKIKNERGEILLDKSSSKASYYIKIEANIQYFVQVTINDKKSYIINKPEFLLNYEEYKDNFLLIDEREITRKILAPQLLLFFKNISDLQVDESLSFKGNTGSWFQNNVIYVKFYKSDDFFSLKESFPSKKDDFDYNLGNSKSNSFNYEIKKIHDSQKGVLFGYFIESTNEYLDIEPTNINIKCEKVKKKEDDSDKKETDKPYDNNDNDSSYNSSSSTIWIIILVFAFCIFIVILCCCIFYNDNKKHVQQSNHQNYQYQNINQNNYNYNNNSNDNNTYYKNDYNNTNYNYSKPDTNNEVIYDYPPCPAINEN